MSQSAPLLEVRDLSVTFDVGRGKTFTAVDHVSFSLDRGETLALVGESGSGKSVTALSILQLLPYPLAKHPAGSSIRFNGEELVGAPEGKLREVRGNRIAMVFQEPMTSLNPLHSIERQIGEALVIHKHLSGAAARARIVELLELVGMGAQAEKRLDAFPHQLSGGQRQRIMIAMALANEPDLLIADEPTTAVDVTIQAQLLKLLKELQAKLGMAMLFITHDLGVVRKIARRVAVMQHGRIVEAGDVARVFDSPQHEYTRHLLSAEPKGRPAKRAGDSPTVVEARDIRVWFPIKAGVLRRTVSHVKAVDGVDLTLHEGHTLGVVGESGSGKTTLGLALLKLETSEGAIRFRGTDIQALRGKALRPLRREMQIVFQDPFGSLSPRLSIGEIIAEGLKIHRIGATEAERAALVVEALREVRLDPDTRLQEVIRLIFARFSQLGSARQVLLSLADEQIHFPRPSDGKKMVSFDWTPIRYRNVISVLKNPFYAGMYVYGKTEKRTAIVDGRVRKTYKHGKPVDRWDVMIKDHHDAYIDWSEFERNQRQLALNAYGKVDGVKTGRGGRALLAGMLCCGRCGRRLSVAYTGRGLGNPVYRCDRPNTQYGKSRCFTFGGRR